MLIARAVEAPRHESDVRTRLPALWVYASLLARTQIGTAAMSRTRRVSVAWIRMIPEEQAQQTPELSDRYQRYAEGSGRLDNIIKIHSLNPRSMDNHMELYVHLMRGRSGLSFTERELIAVAVSAANECHY